jgi:hypothetical protein
MPFAMCLHAHLLTHPRPIDLPVQLAKKELEGALSVDGVEATLLRVRLRIAIACMLSVRSLKCSDTHGALHQCCDRDAAHARAA